MNKFAIARQTTRRAAAVAALAVISATNAQAAAVDVTAIVTAIGEQATPISLVGSATLAIFIGIKAFQWVRQTVR